MWECSASLLVLKNTVNFRYIYMSTLELYIRTRIFPEKLMLNHRDVTIAISFIGEKTKTLKGWITSWRLVLWSEIGKTLMYVSWLLVSCSEKLWASEEHNIIYALIILE